MSADWNGDDYRVEHIARHNIEPDEVWEVCEDPRHLARRHGQIVILFTDKQQMDDTCLLSWRASERLRINLLPREI